MFYILAELERAHKVEKYIVSLYNTPSLDNKDYKLFDEKSDADAWLSSSEAKQWHNFKGKPMPLFSF